MKRIFLLLVSLALALTSAGCVKVQAIKHDPNRAAHDASATLKLIYFDGNINAGYASFDEAARGATTVDDLTYGVWNETTSLGPLNELRAEAYQPVNGQKAIVLFFKATHEKGLAYYRIVMSGDSGGYKLYSFQIAGTPWADASDSSTVRFENPIITTPSSTG